MAPGSKAEMPGPVLGISHLTKRFTGTLALDDVHLDLYAGEIHALLGENGAGKSTLIKILAGVYAPARGEVVLNGKSITLPAAALPISFVHQDLGLVNSMTVTENIALVAGYARAGSLISWRSTRKRAASLLALLGSAISPDAVVSELSSADKSIVAIARALSHESEILVLDEPTATLPESDVATLFGRLAELKKRGISILYVTHRLDEVFRIADRVTVLRNGRNVFSSRVSSTRPSELVTQIVGRDLSQVFVTPPPPSAAETLRVEGLQVEGWVGPVSFAIRAGEVLGLAGLRGAGHDLVGRCIFGARQMTGGRIVVQGKPLARHDPTHAMERGIGFLSSKRVEESIAPGLSARENIYVTTRGSGPLTIIDKRSERQLCARTMSRFSVRPSEPERLIDTFSGGNQQKIMLARWFEMGSGVLILEEPTSGVDVGSKADIYALMNAALKEGKSILLVSSDFEEVAYMCHRVLVFNRGRPVAELAGTDLTVEAVTHVASGLLVNTLPEGADRAQPARRAAPDEE